MTDGMRILWSITDQYYMDLLSGAAVGRRLNVWDMMLNYFEQFRAIGTNIFTYEGISKDLAREIEKRLFFWGRCGLVLHNDMLTAVNANMNGQDIYNEPTAFTFVFGGGLPDDSKTPESREIGRDGVLGRNTFSFYPTARICEQYALMVAHTDCSIVAELVNNRFCDVLIAHSNSEAESARAFNNALYDGRLSFITDKAEEMEINRTGRTVSHLRELIDTKDRLLRDFYNIFGISKAAEKRERMITEEVEANEKMLNFNLKDMLEQRVKMCEEIGRVFNKEVTVKSHIDIDNNGKLEHAQEMEGGTDNAGQT